MGVKQLEGDPFNNFVATTTRTALSRAGQIYRRQGATITLDGEVEGYLRATGSIA